MAKELDLKNIADFLILLTLITLDILLLTKSVLS